MSQFSEKINYYSVKKNRYQVCIKVFISALNIQKMDLIIIIIIILMIKTNMPE